MGTLITESDQPRSFNPPTDGARTHYELGKHCPGITEPHRTNITEFDRAGPDQITGFRIARLYFSNDTEFTAGIARKK